MLQDTLGPSLGAFLPELALCGTIVALLLVRLALPRWKTAAWYVFMAGAFLALYLAVPAVRSPWSGNSAPQEIFTGMLVTDGLSAFLRALLLFFGLLFATFVQISGVPEDHDAADFAVLVLGALLGMCLMISANHMMILFLGVEMASVPCYVLAGMLRERRQSGEAALKYAVYGAGAAGVMLYGISLLSGVLGSAHLPTMAVRLASLSLAGLSIDQTMILILGGLMVAVGLAFKLSAVPFHFWAPDVFEGAPAEIGAFLSIASKTAALGLLVRVALGLSFVSPALEAQEARRLGEDAPAAAVAAADATVADAATSRADAGLAASPADAGSAASPAEGEHTLVKALAPVRKFLFALIALMAAVTCTVGNLAAYGQTNIKRLLAYSTIAHAGYLMMPVAAAVYAAGVDPEKARWAIATMAMYLSIYLFMNFGAFAIVAFLRNATGSERIDDYAGLIRRSPGVAVCMALVMFSLVGLPPLAGFSAKFAIFGSLMDNGLLTLLVIGGLNTALSLFYYLRVVRVMAFAPEAADKSAADKPAAEIPFLSVPGLYCAAITAPLLILFVWWDGLFAFALAAARSLLS